MSFWIVLVNYILPPLFALIGAFFGVLFGSAITIRYFNAKLKKPSVHLKVKNNVGGSYAKKNN